MLDKSQPIIERLEKIREKKGWTTREMAKKVGTTRENYSKWINGHSKPSAEKFENIFEFLGSERANIELTPVKNTNTTIISQDGGKWNWIYNRDTKNGAYVPEKVIQTKKKKEKDDD